MKSYPVRSALAALSVLFVINLSAQTEWTCTFDNLKAGDLLKQEDWKTYNPGPGVVELSPQITPASPPARGFVLAQQPFEGKATSRARKTLPPLFDNRSNLVLEFDARATAAGSIAMFGLGADPVFPATFGIMFDQFAIRRDTFGGEIHVALDSAGKRVTAKRGDWYRVRSEWTRDDANGEWSATLAIRNLTKGESGFTPLSFDRGQNTSVVSLATDSVKSPKNLRVAVVRLGVPGGEIDNLSVTSASH
jgi:hypothetical protein